MYAAFQHVIVAPSSDPSLCLYKHGHCARFTRALQNSVYSQNALAALDLSTGQRKVTVANKSKGRQVMLK